jgi:hypothetical protein
VLLFVAAVALVAVAVLAGVAIQPAAAHHGDFSGVTLTPAGQQASCTAAQQSARQAALRAYQKRMIAQRRAYFRTHASPKLRRAFVKKQRVRLKALQAAAACTVPPPVDTGPVPAPPPGPNTSFTFGGEMSAAAQDEIKGDVAYAMQDEAVLLGAPITSVATFASSNPDWLADQLCRFIGAGSKCFSYAGGPAATSSHGGIFLNWASLSWTSGAPQNQKIIAHELFHVFQYQLDKLFAAHESSSRVYLSGPVWLLEGSAEMVGYRVAVDRRLFPSYASVLAGQISRAKQIGTPLSSLETYDEAQIPNVYGLFSVAVDHLVTVAPGGLLALTGYYNALGAGMVWQDAFRAAFGMSIEAYYANFAAYRTGF